MVQKVCDFVIKIIILFTTVVALIFFAGQYPQHSFTFSYTALILLVSIIVKGIADITADKE